LRAGEARRCFYNIVRFNSFLMRTGIKSQDLSRRIRSAFMTGEQSGRAMPCEIRRRDRTLVTASARHQGDG